MSEIYLKEIEYYELTLEIIRSTISNYIKDNGIKSLVMGISGGIDSALCAAIVKPVCDELNIPLIGRSITIDSNKQDEIDRADAIGHYFCTNFKERDLTYEFEQLESINTFDEGIDVKYDKVADKIRLGNIKARIRMIYLYHLAQSTGGMVLSTDNLTEWLLGFWTLHGDCGDYGIIQNLWKTDVYNMSEWIAENELTGDAQLALLNCIRATATDGLGITNSDLDQILPGFEGSSREGYLEVDRRLKKLVSSGYQNYDKSDPVVLKWLHTRFKRDNPYNIPRDEII